MIWNQRKTHTNMPDWIELEGVCWQVAGVELVRSATATMVAGQVCAIVGPNGAGKSSLLHLVSGQHRPSKGRVRVNGRLLQDVPIVDLARCRAVMAQSNPVAFDFRVRELVEFGRYAHRKHPSLDEDLIVERAMDCCRVTDLSERRIHSLSGGEAARVSLARALVQIWEPQPNLGARWLMLDEPTAALDVAHQLELLQAVKTIATESLNDSPESPIGILMVVHDLNLALRFADQAMVMQAGRIVAFGPCKSTLTTSLVQKVWGVQYERVQGPAGHANLVLA
jgi:iron complex transport system ATP-binding protein